MGTLHLAIHSLQVPLKPNPPLLQQEEETHA